MVGTARDPADGHSGGWWSPLELFSLMDSNSRLTPTCTQALFNPSNQSEARRDTLARALQREVEVLDQAAELLTDLQAEVTGIADLLDGTVRPPVTECLNDLISLVGACRSILRRRRERLHGRYQDYGFREHHAYLYQNGEWTYPVRGDGFEVYGGIQVTKQRFSRLLWFSPLSR